MSVMPENLPEKGLPGNAPRENSRKRKESMYSLPGRVYQKKSTYTKQNFDNPEYNWIKNFIGTVKVHTKAKYQGHKISHFGNFFNIDPLFQLVLPEKDMQIHVENYHQKLNIFSVNYKQENYI